MLQKFLFLSSMCQYCFVCNFEKPAFQGLSIQCAVVALACSYCQLTVG